MEFLNIVHLQNLGTDCKWMPIQIWAAAQLSKLVFIIYVCDKMSQAFKFTGIVVHRKHTETEDRGTKADVSSYAFLTT